MSDTYVNWEASYPFTPMISYNSACSSMARVSFWATINIKSKEGERSRLPPNKSSTDGLVLKFRMHA